MGICIYIYVDIRYIHMYNCTTYSTYAWMYKYVYELGVCVYMLCSGGVPTSYHLTGCLTTQSKNKRVNYCGGIISVIKTHHLLKIVGGVLVNLPTPTSISYW